MAKQIFKTHLNFQEVDPGTIEDKVLVRDSDGNVKEIASTELGGGIEIKGEYNNNGEALAAGLTVGDFYRKPISGDSESAYISQVVNIPEPTAFLKLQFSDTLENIASNFGISDIGNVSNWNDYLTNNGNSVLFESVTIDSVESIVRLNTSSPIAGYLNLSGMNLSAIDFKGCENVISLFLENNNLTVFNPTSELSNLTALDLKKNSLSDFNPVEQLPQLQTINLNENNVTYWNPVNGFPELYNLFLEKNNISTYNPTTSMPKLNHLNLSYNSLTAFDPLLPDSVERIILSNNALTAFALTHVPPLLFVLELNNNNITEFPAMIFPEGFASIQISGNALTVFNSELPNSTQTLNLANNNIENFDPTYLLPSGLYDLDLSGNPLAEFNPTNALPATVGMLILADTLLTEFSPTQPLPTALNHLNLNGTKLTEFNPVNGIYNIKQLNLGRCTELTTFNPDCDLSTVEQIGLYQNPLLTEFNPESPMNALNYLGLSATGITSAGWAGADWVANVPNGGFMQGTSTTDPMIGTATYTALIAKSWAINA